jgi:membrane associated rhomboid family serine protease
MMNIISFADNIQNYSADLFYAMGVVLLINVINWIFLGSFFNILGITPRTFIGLPGILLAIIWHADLIHFGMNAFAFYWLSLLMIALLGPHQYVLTIIALSFISGLLIWILARPGCHIGASAMITGMFSWLVYYAFLHPNPVSLVILTLCLFYFGTIIAGVLPLNPIVSWEGHLLGMIAGIVIVAKQSDVMANLLDYEKKLYIIMGVTGFEEIAEYIGLYIERLQQSL